MKLQRKLVLGLGFLFLIIFALAIFSSFYIQKLSKEANDVLKDNFNSLVYANNMLDQLDGLCRGIDTIWMEQSDRHSKARIDKARLDSLKTGFARSLQAESANITEMHEKEHADTLRVLYKQWLALSDRLENQPGNAAANFKEWLVTSEKMKSSIDSIHRLNMEAIIRKNQITHSDSQRITTYINLLSVLFILLAFAYFRYFPFYVSNTLSVLSEEMQRLLREHHLQLETHSKDEAHILLKAMRQIDAELTERKSAAKTPVRHGVKSRKG